MKGDLLYCVFIPSKLEGVFSVTTGFVPEFIVYVVDLGRGSRSKFLIVTPSLLGEKIIA